MSRIRANIADQKKSSEKCKIKSLLCGFCGCAVLNPTDVSDKNMRSINNGLLWYCDFSIIHCNARYIASESIYWKQSKIDAKAKNGCVGLDISELC